MGLIPGFKDVYGPGAGAVVALVPLPYLVALAVKERIHSLAAAEVGFFFDDPMVFQSSVDVTKPLDDCPGC